MLIILIIYISIDDYILYKSLKEALWSNGKNLTYVEDQEINIDMQNIEDLLYETISEEKIIIDELNKKNNGDIEASIIFLGEMNKQLDPLIELSKVPFLEIKTVEAVNYYIDKTQQLRVELELKNINSKKTSNLNTSNRIK